MYLIIQNPTNEKQPTIMNIDRRLGYVQLVQIGDEDSMREAMSIAKSMSKDADVIYLHPVEKNLPHVGYVFDHCFTHIPMLVKPKE